jgi:hypothetical protein
MTAEVKYFLDLDDVLAVQLECAACHVRSSYPIPNLTHVPWQCPHCKADWTLPDTDTAKTTSAFLVSLGRMAKVLEGQRFKLSLEVDYEEGEALI